MGHLYHGYVSHNQRVTCGQVVLNIKSTDRRGATSSKAPFLSNFAPENAGNMMSRDIQDRKENSKI